MIRLMTALLFLLLPLTAQQGVGEPIAAPIAISGGALTMHEHGWTIDYLDGSTLTATIGGPITLHAEWPHTTSSGKKITISVNFTYPAENPSEVQLASYRAQFRAEVAEMLILFPVS